MNTPLTDGIHRFVSDVGEGYSHTAMAGDRRVPSNYNVLYHLCLCHALCDRDEQVSARMQLLAQGLTDGLLTEDDALIGSNHDRDYVRLHLSALFYQVASIHLPGLPFIGAYDDWDARRLVDVLRELDNSSAWYASNIVMAYAVLMAHNERRGRNKGCLQAIVGHLGTQQDPATGLWFGTRQPSRINAMAAAFHYLPLFKYMGVPPRHAGAMFDSIANLATPEGFFNVPAGYACLDYDGISSLHYLASNALSATESAQRRPVLLRIAAALRANLLNMQRADGGFPEAGPSLGVGRDLIRFGGHVVRNRCFWSAAWNARFMQKAWTDADRIICANSVKACAARASESNAFSTWFRYMTLSSCEDVLAQYGTLASRQTVARKFALPGLGYL